VEKRDQLINRSKRGTPETEAGDIEVAVPRSGDGGMAPGGKGKRGQSKLSVIAQGRKGGGEETREAEGWGTRRRNFDGGKREK